MPARLILACILASLVPAIVWIAVLKFFASGSGFRHETVMVLLFSVSIGYPGFIFGGLPLIRILRHFNQLNLPALVFGGAALGIIFSYLFGFAFSWMLDSSRPLAPYRSEIIWGIVEGASVALVFAIISGIPLRSPVR